MAIFNSYVKLPEGILLLKEEVRIRKPREVLKSRDAHTFSSHVRFLHQLGPPKPVDTRLGVAMAS